MFMVARNISKKYFLVIVGMCSISREHVEIPSWEISSNTSVPPPPSLICSYLAGYENSVCITNRGFGVQCCNVEKVFAGTLVYTPEQ